MPAQGERRKRDWSPWGQAMCTPADQDSSALEPSVPIALSPAATLRLKAAPRTVPSHTVAFYPLHGSGEDATLEEEDLEEWEPAMCPCKEGNSGVTLECASSVWAKVTAAITAPRCTDHFWGSPHPAVSLGARSHLLRLREDKRSRTHSGCMTNKSLNVGLLTPNYALSSS